MALCLWCNKPKKRWWLKTDNVFESVRDLDSAKGQPKRSWFQLKSKLKLKLFFKERRVRHRLPLRLLVPPRNGLWHPLVCGFGHMLSDLPDLSVQTEGSLRHPEPAQLRQPKSNVHRGIGDGPSRAGEKRASRLSQQQPPERLGSPSKPASVSECKFILKFPLAFVQSKKLSANLFSNFHWLLLNQKN